MLGERTSRDTPISRHPMFRHLYVPTPQCSDTPNRDVGTEWCRNIGSVFGIEMSEHRGVGTRGCNRYFDISRLVLSKMKQAYSRSRVFCFLLCFFCMEIMKSLTHVRPTSVFLKLCIYLYLNFHLSSFFFFFVSLYHCFITSLIFVCL